MTAAGDRVLQVAYGEVGYVEGPDNSTKYWSWYGANLGPWCGVFAMWCDDQAGVPTCTDAVLVSNGTWHAYTTGGSGATGVEAQTTPDLQPGDHVLFSWEPWAFEGGVPICQGEWQGYVAGDHIGIFAYWVDQAAGRFAAVEGNTSDGSWDNGGMVLLREDRYTSQVCGWWRPEGIAAGGPGQPPEEEEVTEADFAQIRQIVFDVVYNLWREKEMENLDIARAQQGAFNAVYPLLAHEPEIDNVFVDRAHRGANRALGQGDG